MREWQEASPHLHCLHQVLNANGILFQPAGGCRWPPHPGALQQQRALGLWLQRQWPALQRHCCQLAHSPQGARASGCPCITSIGLEWLLNFPWGGSGTLSLVPCIYTHLRPLSCGSKHAASNCVQVVGLPDLPILYIAAGGDHSMVVVQRGGPGEVVPIGEVLTQFSSQLPVVQVWSRLRRR